MKVEDIQSYSDLEKYIKLQLAVQTATKKIMSLELNEIWFFKLAKLVKFSIEYNPKEKGVKGEIALSCEKYVLKINGVFTIVTRR